MRHRLTPEIEQKILGLVRAGVYAWVAAEAAGIPAKVFRRWMQNGSRTGRRPYRRFFLEVMQARAMARARAEMDTRDKAPRFWLERGPGREAPGRPGWTSALKPGANDKQAQDVLAAPGWMKLWPEILRALEAFPDARSALIRTLDGSAAPGGPAPDAAPPS